jgi:hypothetical protein
MSNKTTAVATTTKKTNATKTNAILSHTDLLKNVQTLSVGHTCKVFTDNANYVGIGKKCNGFSVNVKKTKYNVFCNDDNFSVLRDSKQFTDCTFTENGNSCDKTRPHYIEVKNTDTLKKMFTLVLKQYQPTTATDTN